MMRKFQAPQYITFSITLAQVKELKPFNAHVFDSWTDEYIQRPVLKLKDKHYVLYNITSLPTLLNYPDTYKFEACLVNPVSKIKYFKRAGT